MSMPRIGRRHHHRDEPRGREQPSANRHKESRHHRTAPNNKTVAAFCVAAAFLAFGIVLATEQIAYTSHEPANIVLNSFACLFSVAALAIGGYTQTLQAHYRSRRTRNRLLIGMPVAALTLAVTIVNFRGHLPSAGKPADGAVSASVALEPESQEMFGPGWYGEAHANGIEAVVVSFAENAPQSRAFNRLLRQRVSYATMTVINQSRQQPAVLKSAQVMLVLASGEEVPSLAARPMIRVADADEAVMQHLAETRTIAQGAIAPDIPICADADFRWERVRAVKLIFDGFALLVPGRMMTADEKFSLMMKQEATTKPEPAAASTNQSAEAWLKDL